MSDSILLDIAAPVATVTLNRPEIRNAFNVEMWDALTDALHEAGSRHDVRAIVIRGAGDKAFAAGADLKEFPQTRSTAEQSQRYGRLLEHALGAVREARQPVIAQIHGFCIGGGCELATACDVRIGADDAKIGITPAKMGLILQFAEIRSLVALVGQGVAKDLLFSGRLMDAAEALRVGYLNFVVPVAELETFTKSYVDSFIDNAPISIEAAKRAINACVDGVDNETVADQVALFVRNFASGDAQEGYKAFTEKRKPQFKGD